MYYMTFLYAFLFLVPSYHYRAGEELSFNRWFHVHIDNLITDYTLKILCCEILNGFLVHNKIKPDPQFIASVHTYNVYKFIQFGTC